MNLQITKFFHVFALTLSTLDVDIFNLLHKLNITKVSHIRPIQSNFTSLYYVCRFNMLLGLWGSFHEQCVGFINMKVTISLLSLQLNIILILNTRYAQFEENQVIVTKTSTELSWNVSTRRIS